MKISRKKFIISASGLFVSGLLFDSLLYEKYFFEENYFSLPGPDPALNNSIKILQISDLHLNSVGFGMKKLAKKITEISPDIICITGDSIDDKRNIPILEEFLQLLPHSIPKVSILGNWEHMTDVNIRDLNAAYKKNNCTLLINESLVISSKERKIIVSGIDEYTHGKPDFQKAVKEIGNDHLHIMLCHSPGYIDVIRQNLREEKFKHLSVNLVLSGHTHGGQINLGGFVPYLPPGSKSYLKGWYKDQEPHLYVSKGIGTTILPMRLGAPAEIAIFNFS